MPLRPLEIPGYGGTPLPCVLHSTGDERGIAVVFPGAGSHGNRLGGSPARPDLHYTREILEAAGLAVLEVWWDAGSAPEGDREGWLDANVAAALARASGEFDLALLVGRSLGTWALARALSASKLPINDVPTVWLAPLLAQPEVSAALEQLQAPAFVVGGGDDPAFVAAEAEALTQRGVEVVVLDGANHGLEVDDPPTSARLMADTLERLRSFVARAAAEGSVGSTAPSEQEPPRTGEADDGT